MGMSKEVPSFSKATMQDNAVALTGQQSSVMAWAGQDLSTIAMLLVVNVD